MSLLSAWMTNAHSIMERHLRNLSYCQTFDSVVKGNSCSGGFRNTILEVPQHGMLTIQKAVAHKKCVMFLYSSIIIYKFTKFMVLTFGCVKM